MDLHARQARREERRKALRRRRRLVALGCLLALAAGTIAVLAVGAKNNDHRPAMIDPHTRLIVHNRLQ